MNKRTSFIALSLVLLAALCGAQQTASLDARKISMENELQSRVENAMSKMLEPRDFIAIVNVEMGEEKTEYNPGGTAKKIRLLPGVPERQKVGEKEDVMMSESIYRYFIINISVSLTIDAAVSEARIVEVKDLVTKLLSLNFKRGDVIEIKRSELYVRQSTAAVNIVNIEKPKNIWIQLFERKDIVWIIPLMMLIIMLSVFLFGTLRKFFSQVVTILPSLKTRSGEGHVTGNTQQAGGGGGGAGMGMGGAAESTVTFKSGQNTQKHPFSFVNRANLNNLFLLVKDRSPEQIASVLHYLDSELSSILLSKLEPKIRAAILLTIPAERQFSPEEVDSLDAEIRQNINYLIGGMDKLIAIYESSDNDTQQQMMSMLAEHRPDIVEKIKQSTVTFDDLFRLDKSSLRMVLREVPLRSLAISLKNSGQEFKDRILEILPEGMSEILKEEIEFSQTVSATKIEEEQRKIIQLVRKLGSEGRIVINHSGAPLPAEERPVPAPRPGAPARTPERRETARPPERKPAGTPAAKPEASTLARLLAERKLQQQKKKSS